MDFEPRVYAPEEQDRIDRSSALSTVFYSQWAAKDGRELSEIQEAVEFVYDFLSGNEVFD